MVRVLLLKYDDTINIDHPKQVNEGIDESEMKKINFIVLGPVEDKTSHKTMCKTVTVHCLKLMS